MIEKEMQNYVIKILENKGIDYIHIPNRTFSKNMTTPKCLKYFPDICFCYGGKVYMREFGIKGKHKDRKELQAKRMDKWNKQGGVDIDFYFTYEEIDIDLTKINIL